MDGIASFLFETTHSVDSLTGNIHQATFYLVTDRHYNRLSCSNNFHSSSETIG